MRKQDSSLTSSHAAANDCCACFGAPGQQNQEHSRLGAEVNLLLRVLGSEYHQLLDRLSSALHSPDAASEALHDAYLKLGSGPQIGEVRRPLPYLYRIAINLAKNRRRHEALLNPVSLPAAEALPDEAPDPERIVGAKREMERALELLHRLPEQRREIFLSRWRDDLGQAEIAMRFGLHKRTVQKELVRAERYLRANLGR